MYGKDQFYERAAHVLPQRRDFTGRGLFEAEDPNTVLAFIPLGSSSYNIPITQVSSVTSSFYPDTKLFIIGILIACSGIFGMVSTGGGNQTAYWIFVRIIAMLILLILSVPMVISSLRTVLAIDTTAGARQTVSFLVFEKDKAEQAAAMINRSISLRHSDTNVRKQNTVLGDRPVNAIDSINKR